MPKRILETYDLDAAIKKNRYLELVGREVYWRSIEVIGRRVSWQKDIIVGIVTFLTTGKLALEVELVCAICHIASEKHLLVQDLRDNIWCHVDERWHLSI